VKYKKNFSKQRAKPTEAKPLRKVSIAKVILQAQIFFVANGTAYLTFVIFTVSHSVTRAVLLQLPNPSLAQPDHYIFLLYSDGKGALILKAITPCTKKWPGYARLTKFLVAMVTYTQLFLSQTSILMCNSFLSNWNGNPIDLEKFNAKKFHRKKFSSDASYDEIFLPQIIFMWIFSTTNFSQTMVCMYVCMYICMHAYADHSFIHNTI